IEGIVFTVMFNKLMRALYLFRIDHYQRWLSPYIDGELDTRTRSRVERHLEQCTVCRADYESMLRASQWVSHLPVPEAAQKAFKVPDAFGTSGGRVIGNALWKMRGARYWRRILKTARTALAMGGLGRVAALALSLLL